MGRMERRHTPVAGPAAWATRVVPGLVLVGLAFAGCSDDTGGDGTTTAPSVRAPQTTAAQTTGPSTTALPTTAPSTSEPPTTSPATTGAPALDRGDESTVARMRSDLGVLLANGPRVAGSSSEAAAVQAFAAEAATITGITSSLERVPLSGGGASRNVWVAEVGSGDRVLLLGAHLDTVEGSPGADDNGSGLVVLLELLRRLVAAPPTEIRVAVVAFGAEEVLPGMGSDAHHFGSRLAAERLETEDALPDWMISVDMVGLGERLMAVSYEDTDPSLVVEMAASGAAVGVPVTTLSRGDISDHEAFARAGVPSAFLWRPDNPTWHTPDDTEVVDAALLENLAVLETLVSRLAEQP